MKKRTLILFIFALILTSGCSNQPDTESAAVTRLSSWNVPGEGTGQTAAPTFTIKAGSTTQSPLPGGTPAPTITLAPGAQVGQENSGTQGGGAMCKTCTRNAEATIYASSRVPDPTRNPGGGSRTPSPESGGTVTPATPVTPVTPTPTPTLSPEQAPVFPETPTRAFDASHFITILEEVRDSFRSFSLDWIPIIRETRERNPGDCGAYLGWYTLWVTEAPAYTNVPESWQPLYIEYRLLLRNAVFSTGRVRRNCPWVYPGEFDDNLDPTIIFPAGAARLEAMVLEANQLVN